MLSPRPPIIVILGHVDHGKTTLLDYLRKTNIAARETGGITQSTRSFQLAAADSQLMTFIDTPGHAAFPAMRERGSKIADLAVLIIAADDGVMPQTKECIALLKSTGTPFIVAISKIDLPDADPDRIKTQLTENQVVVEDFGGDVPVVLISAKNGKGITELLEMITLVVSLNPPQADPEGSLELVVLESRLDSRKGPLAVVVVKNGTLIPGLQLFQDASIGKVRALLGTDGEKIQSAGPSLPVEILGLSVVPEVGSAISDRPIHEASPVLLSRRETLPSESKINLILKADVAGSLEAILSLLPPEFTVISSGTGDLTESDILLARTSKGYAIGFNLKPSANLLKLAETEKVTLKNFNIIYELVDFLGELLHPKTTTTVVGKADILADFKIDSERVAGCRCREGQIDKTSSVAILRGEKEVGVARIKSLRLGKNSIEKAKAGTEFGAVFSPYVDFKVGDSIIATTG